MLEKMPSDPPLIRKGEIDILHPVLDRVIEMGLVIGRFVGNHIFWEPKPNTSDLYRASEESVPIQPQPDWRESEEDWEKRWAQQYGPDLTRDVARQLHIQFDSEGNWHNPDGTSVQ